MATSNINNLPKDWNKLEEDLRKYLISKIDNTVIIIDIDEFTREYNWSKKEMDEILKIRSSKIQNNINIWDLVDFVITDIKHELDMPEEKRAEELQNINHIDIREKIIIKKEYNKDYKLCEKTIAKNEPKTKITKDRITKTYETINLAVERFKGKYYIMFKIYTTTKTINPDNGKEISKSTTVNDILLFSYERGKKITDIFLNQEYYNVKNIFTIKSGATKTEDYRGTTINKILDYIGSKATKILENNIFIIEDITELIKQLIYETENTSSLLAIIEHDNNIVFPKVMKNPIMHEYTTMPNPEELWEQLNETTISKEETEQILKKLTDLDRDHNIITVAYYMATLLVSMLKCPTPQLILYGESGVGKSATAELFSFLKIQADNLTPPQVMKSCQGYGCGFYLLDEASNISKQIIDMLKDISTAPIYNKTYGRTGQKYIFKTGGVLTFNDPLKIQTITPADIQAILRRNITLKTQPEDELNNIEKTMEFLKENHLKLKKIFIEYLLNQKPERIKEKYESINMEYLKEKYDIITTIKTVKSYQFIVLGLELLKEMFDEYNIQYITEERIQKILKRIKDTEKEYRQDILNASDIITMIEQIIYNEIIRMAAMKDKDPENITDHSTLNKYSEMIFKANGYTIYYMKDKKRIAINRTGLSKLIKKLNADYNTNYPEKTTENYFINLLNENGINAVKGRKRISSDTKGTKPNAIFIEVPYNYDLKEYEDILIIIEAMAQIYNGGINIKELKEQANKRKIPQNKVMECLNALKTYNIAQEIDTEIIKINIDELKKACEIIEEDDEEQIIPPKISNDEEIILEVIKKAKKIYGNEPVDIETIYYYTYEEGLKRDDVDRAIKKLLKKGIIREVRNSEYDI